MITDFIAVWIFNIAIILFQLYYIFFTGKITYSKKKKLKEKRVVLNKNKLIPTLFWEDGTITICKPKEMKQFIEGDIYEWNISKMVFINPFNEIIKKINKK